MLVIGLSGKMGVGKTSIARELLTMIPNSYVLPMAQALRIEVCAAYLLPLDMTMTAEGKKTTIEHPALSRPMTVREIMQWHGQVRRAEQADYWTRRWSEALTELGANGARAVIVDDIRFPNEADMVRSRGGYIVRVHPYAEWIPGPFSADVSETAMDQEWAWDMEISPAYGQDGLTQAAAEIVYAAGGAQ